MKISPRCRCGSRTAAAASLAILLAPKPVRAADGPGAAAFAAMMKAWQAGKLDDAIKSADAVLKAEPSNLPYLNAIGGLYCDKAEEASVLRKLSWAGKGQTLAALGRRADAVAALETALKLDPKHAPASRELQRLKG